MRGARLRRVLVMKYTALITDPRQKRPMHPSHTSVPRPCPGPEAASALKGAYCVHPASDPPPGTKNAEISSRNETSVTQNADRCSRGKVISEAPSCNGRK